MQKVYVLYLGLQFIELKYQFNVESIQRPVRLVPVVSTSATNIAKLIVTEVSHKSGVFLRSPRQVDGVNFNLLLKYGNSKKSPLQYVLDKRCGDYVTVSINLEFRIP